jgi:hypothetical protein
MTSYNPLFRVMREDLNEYDWMNVEWWLPRARALAANVIHQTQEEP